MDQQFDETSDAAGRPSKLGIGLIIVKKIIHLHHYSIKAEAISGTGNTFTIGMPVVQNHW